MGFAGDTAAVVRREAGRIRRSPLTLVLMFVLPLLSLLFFVAVFQKGVPRDIDIAVADGDNTALSRRLTSMFDATPAVRVAYKVADATEGERMIRRGEIRAVVMIPEGFERDILGGDGAQVVAWVSGVNITANGMIAKDLQTAATTFSAGVTMQLLMSRGVEEQQALALAMPVQFDRHVLFNPYTNYGYYLLPVFLPMMLMIFTMVLTIFAAGSELRYSTAGEWMAAARGGMGAALIGKLLPYTLAMFAVGMAMNIVMYRVVGVPLGGSAAVLVASSFMFVLAYQSIAVLMVAVLANLRLSLSIGGGYSVLAFTFSGFTFPLMAMDPALQAFSYLFPFTVYSETVVDQAVRGAPAAYALGQMGVLALYIVLPMLCLPRLKKVVNDKRYWGRL